MLAVEFTKPGTRTPDPDLAKQVQARALARGLLLLTCGVHANVIRFLFPLTIPDAVFAEGLGALEEALLAR
jgi:4-aminobutyrate aminotransferase